MKNKLSLLSNHIQEEEEKENNPLPAIYNRQIDVLIVDDSPYNLFILQEMLQSISSINEIDQALHG